MQILGPTPDLLSQKFQGRGQAICVLTNLPEALDAHQSLRIHGLAERNQFISKSTPYQMHLSSSLSIINVFVRTLL